MSKYDKMLEVNHKQSVEKIQRAKLTIQEMIEEEDKVTVPKLMQKTGLSRGFFYKNPEVRKAVDRALQLQAGMIDKRRKILDMAMDQPYPAAGATGSKTEKRERDITERK